MAVRLQAVLAHLSGVTPGGSRADSFVARLMAVGYSGSTRGDAPLKDDTLAIDEDFARSVLNKIKAAVGAGSQYPIGSAFRSAYDKAVEGAEMIEGFTKKHPVWSTVIALGILAISYAPAIKILGFGAKGVAKASYAAAWQSTYGADVPARSLFAYLQHLGATMPV